MLLFSEAFSVNLPRVGSLFPHPIKIIPCISRSRTGEDPAVIGKKGPAGRRKNSLTDGFPIRFPSFYRTDFQIHLRIIEYWTSFS